MNYLSHHALARRILPEGDPLFYTGNLLPDLLAQYGLVKLRAVHLPSEEKQNGPLLSGIRLHFTTDVRFHASPTFKQACDVASEQLRLAPFSTPLRRVFFLGHILVEVALDGHLLRQDPGLAKDMYSCLLRAASNGIDREMSALLPKAPPSETAVSDTLERFIGHGWLSAYATYEGQTEALYRICRSAGVPLPDDDAGRSLLTDTLVAFAPKIASFATDLLSILPGT